MNYRHAYHAGNFADVVKHAVLCRVLAYLREKPAAFRVIDTHAGAGVYDLTATEAGKTGEWRDGIGRLLSAQIDPDVRALARALSRRGRRLQSARAAHDVSRLAHARAQLVAAAGSADRVRTRTARGRGARAQFARRRAREDHRHRRLDGVVGICSTQGTARRGAGRSSVRTAGRIRATRQRTRERAPQMADRHLPALVSDQGAGRGRQPSPAASFVRASQKSCGWNSMSDPMSHPPMQRSCRAPD